MGYVNSRSHVPHTVAPQSTLPKFGASVSVSDFGADGAVSHLAVDTDDSVYIVGTFTHIGSYDRNGIAKLTPSLRLDTSFDPEYVTNWDGFARGVAIDADGNVLVVTNSGSGPGFVDEGLLRYLPDGSLDPAFDTTYTSVASRNTGSGMFQGVLGMADGTILCSGHWGGTGAGLRNVVRLNNDGTHDTSFDAPDLKHGAWRFWVQGDGQILTSGNYRTDTSPASSRRKVARLNTDGSLDGSYDAGAAFGQTGLGYDVIEQGDGKVLVGGTDDSHVTVRCIRTDSAGANDGGWAPTFGSGFGGTSDVVLRMLLDGSGKVVIIGAWDNDVDGSSAYPNFARLNSDSTLDTGFDENVFADLSSGLGPLDMGFQSDGSIVVGGTFQFVNDVVRANIAKFDADGVLQDV